MSAPLAIGVLGGGAWGTALATVARRNGHAVTIYAREPEVVDDINTRHRNARFLPDAALDPAIRATTDATAAIGGDLVIVGAPTQYLRAVLAPLAPRWPATTPAVLLAKGLEAGTLSLPSEVAAHLLPGIPTAVLSGPSFAAEVANGLPAAVTVAASDLGLCRRVAAALGTPRFRIYASDDVTGVGIGGAVKNVLAIACGIVAGRGLGDNARAALITRGLVELTRFAVAHGARAETLMGLAGLGDLVLTATAGQSRNYTLGHAIGQGTAVADALKASRGVAEGAFTVASVAHIARRLGLEMPITLAVDAVLNHDADVDETIASLLNRPFRAEA